MSSEEGVLTIHEDRSIGLHSIHDLDAMNKDRTLTLEIPATYTGNISIRTRTGAITISGMDIAGDVALTTPYGSVEVSNLIVQGDLSVSSDTGSLYLEDVSADGLIRAESKTGALSLTNIKSKDLLDVTTRMGSITLKDADAVTMEIATQYGAVRARGISVEDDIHIYSYSGDITCRLRDEADAFTVTCGSTRGRINLPDEQGSGDKRLDIESSMGDITVRFGV